MLYQFKFKNFKSYKNETVFDMRAENIKEFEESIIVDKNGERILPVSVIYGANAGGKSSLLEALVCFISIIIKPRRILIDKSSEKKSYHKTFAFYNDIIPYKFDEESTKKPTEFEMFFSTNNNEYKYDISILKNEIITENLYKKEFTGKKPAKIFERNKKNIVLGEILKKNNVSINVNENMPYLTYLSITNNVEVIKDVIEYFENVTAINYAKQTFEEAIKVYGEKAKKMFLKILEDMDIDICDYRIEKKENGVIKFFTKHKNNNKEYELQFAEESEGTKKIFSLLPNIIDALLSGGLAILDELDAKLHPKLLKYVIMMFKDKNMNISNAQLIFTSQDLITMSNEVFRRDEIWFACKNEKKESEIYSLYEIRDENGEHIRANAAFNKQYLTGKYGADPYLSRMLSWEE